MNGKYYWLKLKKDFFKRHDIKILEAMPDGHKSVLFYLKLMLESIDHEGELRFSEQMPYSPEMLAIITDMGENTVKESLKRLQELGLLEITQDGTIVLNQVKTMIGSAADNDNARRQRRFREKKKAENNANVTDSNVTNVIKVTDSNVTPVTKNNESKSIEIEIDKEIDIEKRNVKEKRQIFVPPTVEEVSQYCIENKIDVDPDKFFNFYEAKGWYVGKNKMKNWKAAIRTWERNDARRYEPKQPSLYNGNPFDGIE